MVDTLTLGSLFDGIGGWQIAAIKSGIKPIWSSEIEKFPMDVTKKWFPNTIQLGDITEINGAEIQPVDIICAGSPCQDLSVAGKRAGLEGERSGLFRKAVDIVRDMRKATEGQYPRYFVWENVPGAFSSNKGADFRVVLEEIGQTNIPMPTNGRWANAGLVECEECEIAWRVLDAQYWGVPQRRKRIFLVADFAKTGRSAGKVLFIEQSLSGNITQSERERENPPREAEDSTREASTGIGTDLYNRKVSGSKAVTITSATGSGSCSSGPTVIQKTVGALCADDHKGINNQYVDQGKCVIEDADIYNHKLSGDKAVTFTTGSGSSASHSGPTVIEGFDEYSLSSTGEVSRTIANRDYKGGTCVYPAEYWKDNQPQTCDTLTSSNAGGAENAR